MKQFIRHSTVITALVFLASHSAQAQQVAPGPRWLSLLGCWSIAQAGTAADGQHAGRLVCITPTPDANVVDISAIGDGKVLTRDRVDASGRSYPMEVPGCTGTQRANWSADERRVYLRSSVTCSGVTTEMSALLALTLTGNWLDVRRVWSGHPDSAQVHVARYRDVGLPSGVPQEIASKLREYAMSIETGRIAASVPIGAPAIIEASKLADSTIVAAWLTESGQRFALDSREWKELADAGVSAQVRDAMDETVHPSARSTGGRYEEYGRWSRQASASWDQGTGQRKVFPKEPMGLIFYDPWGFGVGYGGWAYGVRDGYLAAYGFGGLGNPLDVKNALGYLFGLRCSTTGYVRPNVMVLKDNVGTGSDGVATTSALPEPKGDDAKKAPGTTATTKPGASTGSSAGNAPAQSSAPVLAPKSGGSITVRP